MLPMEYAELVVLPTVREFINRPGDRRLAYLSAITAFHLIDYLTKGFAEHEKQDRRKDLKARDRDTFAVIEGLCHGTKHAGRNGGDLRFTPGDEKIPPVFGFAEATGCVGFGQEPFGPERIVVEHNGRGHIVDVAVVQFLCACQDAFPEHLAGIDLSDLHI